MVTPKGATNVHETSPYVVGGGGQLVMNGSTRQRFPIVDGFNTSAKILVKIFPLISFC